MNFELPGQKSLKVLSNKVFIFIQQTLTIMSYLYSYRHNLTQLLEEINLQKPAIKIPTFVTHDLVDTYQICRLIDDFIFEYFQENRKTDTDIADNRDQKIDDALEEFQSKVVEKILKEKQDFKNISLKKKKGFKNIFEFAQCENLYLSNKYVNLISESLGHTLEEIASISSQVFVPEKILNFKIKGVDLVVFNQGIIKYTQLKTKKDTLTGSQSDRSINEFKIHPNSVFAAALDMGNSWTISKTKAKENNIELLAGQAFWSMLDLDYETILNKLKMTVRKIEKKLYQV